MLILMLSLKDHQKPRFRNFLGLSWLVIFFQKQKQNLNQIYNQFLFKIDSDKLFLHMAMLIFNGLSRNL